MSNGSDATSAPGHPSAKALSALVDGEVDAGAVAAACAAWRDDASSRATWHAYHLIGDVLRSDDLASRPARDADFLAALRVRLDAEPIVLAPGAAEPTVQPAEEFEVRQRVGAARNSRWSWKAPSAVAAGFVVVAGVLMMTNPSVPGVASPDASLATSVASPTARVAMLPADPAASALQVSETLAPPTFVNAPNRQLIRDARLDRYLSAHKEFAGSTALGVPSGFLRDAVAESPSR